MFNSLFISSRTGINLTSVLLSILFAGLILHSTAQCEITLEKSRSGKQKVIQCARVLDIIINNHAIQVFEIEVGDTALVVSTQYYLNEEARDTTILLDRAADIASIEGLVICTHKDIEKCAQVRDNQKFGDRLEKTSNIIIVAGIAGFVITGNYYFAAGAGAGIILSAMANRILRVKYYRMKKKWKIVDIKSIPGPSPNQQNSVE